MKNLKIKSAALAAVAATFLLGTGTTFAGPWQFRHPRRAEVNHRLGDQSYRIRQGVKDGQLDPAQVHQLRSEDRSILKQEDLYAHYDDGHISKPEQKVLNTEENQVSKQIYVDRHDGE